MDVICGRNFFDGYPERNYGERLPMSHYKANVRDLEFNLFEVLEPREGAGHREFGDLDGEAVRQMLAEAARLAQGPLAESSPTATATPPTLDPPTPRAELPDSFKSSVWASAARRGGRC